MPLRSRQLPKDHHRPGLAEARLTEEIQRLYVVVSGGEDCEAARVMYRVIVFIFRVTVLRKRFVQQLLHINLIMEAIRQPDVLFGNPNIVKAQ